MTATVKKQDQPKKDRFEPVVLPDVATEAHPIVTIPQPPAAEDEPPILVDMPEDAPVGDYVRQIQLEFEEQEELGKV